MGCEIEKMVLDLNALLQDICKFLSSDKLEKLSPKDQKLAQSLINRSKTQLQEIAKIQPMLQQSEDYVEMNNRVIPVEEESDVYSSVEDLNVNVTKYAKEDNEINPFRDLPAKSASYNVKFGWISMRKKFLLGFEKMKRVFATIHENWLLIYLSEKDIKPLCTINLKNFNAKESDGEKAYFELINNKQSGPKMYHFTALTHKDMLQWTTHLNMCYNKLIVENNSNFHDIGQYSSRTKNSTAANVDYDDDTIYEKITTMINPSDDKVISTSVIPNRSLISNTFPKAKPFLKLGSKELKLPIKVPPPVVKASPELPLHVVRSPPELILPGSPTALHSGNNSSESIVSYDDICVERKSFKSNTNSTQSFDDSFSDGSEDSTYEIFTDTRSTFALNKVDHTDKSSNDKVGSYPDNLKTTTPLAVSDKISTSSFGKNASTNKNNALHTTTNTGFSFANKDNNFPSSSHSNKNDKMFNITLSTKNKKN